MKNNNQYIKSKEISPVRWILGGLILVTLYFQTNLADPFNSPKSWTLFVISAGLVGYVFTSIKIIKSNRVLQTSFYLAFFFAASMLLATIFTDFKYTALIGDVQRRNGFLSYLSLVIIFIASTMFFKLFNTLRIYYCALVVGGITIIYALLQVSGKDFIKWNNPYNSIIATVGNPNFASALMAILGVVFFSALFNSEISKYFKVSATLATPLLIYLIYKSQSRQGLIAYLLGIGIFTIIYLREKNKVLSQVAMISGASIFMFSILGMLQIGPLQRFLYKPSVSVRGYYWRAAIEMFKDKPLTGVGVDRYAYYFKQFREVGYPLNYGYNITSSNAHNTFLQFFATGGFLVGISYLALNFYVLKRALVGIKSFTGNSRLFLAGLVAAWVAFQAQSLISIDNIGVSIWGWVLGGAIIGISISESTTSLNDKKIYYANKNEINLERFLISSLFLSLSAILIIFLYRGENNTYLGKLNFNLQDPNTRIAFKNQQYKIINSKLIDPAYVLSASMDLIQAGFIEEGIPEAEKIYSKDKLNLDAINVLALTYERIGNIEKAIFYRQRMAELDKWNAENYYMLGKLYRIQGNLVKSREMLEKIDSFASNTPIALQAKSELAN